MVNTEKGSGMIITIILVVIAILVGLWVAGNKTSTPTQEAVTPNTVVSEEKMMEDKEEGEMDEKMEEGEMADEGMMDKEEEEEEEMMDKEEVATNGGIITNYSEGVLANGPETQILFFHAEWCPSCRTLEGNLKSENAIPENVAIYKIDYDAAKDLKAKYQVRTQHTLVQVDKEGRMIKSWSGGANTANVISQIQG